MKVEFGFEIILLLVIVPILLGYLLNKKYGLYSSWIDLIKEYAPLWLIFFPAIITYLFVTGSLSATTVYVYHLIRGKEGFVGEEFLFLENVIEFLCSFFMLLVYFSILRKNKFPSFWIIIITLVHMIVAGYRDAKLIYLPNGKKESGPIILEHFQLLDAMFPLLSLVVFGIYIYRKNLKESNSFSS